MPAKTIDIAAILYPQARFRHRGDEPVLPEGSRRFFLPWRIRARARRSADQMKIAPGRDRHDVSSCRAAWSALSIRIAPYVYPSALLVSPTAICMVASFRLVGNS